MAITTPTTGSIFLLDTLVPASARDKQQAAAWEEYQSNIDKRILMLQDDWKQDLCNYIMERMHKQVREYYFPQSGRVTPLMPLPMHLNIFKRVIEQISQIYNRNAIRSFRRKVTDANIEGELLEPKFEQDKRFSDIVGDRYNSVLQLVNRMANACNIVGIRPVPDRKERTGFRYDILTPDQFYPYQDPDNPSRLIGLIYVVDMTDTNDSRTSTFNIDTRREVLFYIGREGEEPFFAEATNRDEDFEKQPYPWINSKGEPYIPIAFFRSEEPLTGEFVNRTRGEDLYQGTLHTGDLLARWELAYKTTSHKQLALLGHDLGELPENMVKDGISILPLPISKDDGEVQIFDWQINLESNWVSLQKYIESIISNYGLSLDKFKATPQSGLSIKLQNEDLISRIKSQQELFRSSERDLAEIIRMENNRVYSGREFSAIDENAEFQIDFGDLPFEPEPLELVDQFEKLAQKGVFSWAEILKRFNPDIPTIEEAQEIIKRNMRLNRESRGSSGIQVPGGGQTPPPIPEDETEPTPNLLTEPIATDVEGREGELENAGDQ